MAPVAVFVGVMGAGKSTIGAAVAAELGVAFADTDAIIEDRAGKPIPDIFVEDGEPAFRDLERRTVADVLATFDGVLALGGGAILDEGTRKLLAGHTVVYLSVELADAIKRVGLGAGRPLLAINPRATLRHLLEQRRPLYLEVATHTVATDGREEAETTAEVLTLLRR
ncbi:shikimate kinase [Actinoplanes campanulatus]|uniref:Shikimate kinase n=1 Tax=Actinoplanes campanulatus TaxID=113559 RepID=A0A7W5A9W0_9ACTN|nr:shikimate kinase [Actinoplanes campanulatus]MBB3092386.1 shikimate kinase [Actinoplanes campanulatus]GGN47778.1 shikimate kinase [Actinoplanes campanulatus]GID34520.1 shikimate kinase [Actinoplanes campanulatus]